MGRRLSEIWVGGRPGNSFKPSIFLAGPSCRTPIEVRDFHWRLEAVEIPLPIDLVTA